MSRDNNEIRVAAARYSDACTRSGITAIVLAAVISAIGPSVLAWEAYSAALRYSMLRHNLSNSLIAFQETGCWQRISEANQAYPPLTWGLGDFLGRCGTEREVALPRHLLPKPEPKPRSEAAPQPPPAPILIPDSDTADPIVGRIHSVCYELFEPSLWVRARAHSAELEISIDVWRDGVEAVLADLARRDQMPSFLRRDRYWKREVPFDRLMSNAIRESLTLEDLGKIAALALPPDPGTIEERWSSGPYRLSVPSIPLDLAPQEAVRLLSLGLLLVAIYFWAHLLSASRQDEFPVAATIFGVFRETRFLATIMVALMLIPLASFVRLLWISSVPYTVIGVAIAIGLITVHSILVFLGWPDRFGREYLRLLPGWLRKGRQ